MKSTDKSQTIENPWAEGMKGSHDASWLGRLWRGFVGRAVPAGRVVDSYGKTDQKSSLTTPGIDDHCSDPYSQENMNNPAFHDFRN